MDLKQEQEKFLKSAYKTKSRYSTPCTYSKIYLRAEQCRQLFVNYEVRCGRARDSRGEEGRGLAAAVADEGQGGVETVGEGVARQLPQVQPRLFPESTYTTDRL